MHLIINPIVATKVQIVSSYRIGRYFKLKCGEAVAFAKLEKTEWC